MKGELAIQEESFSKEQEKFHKISREKQSLQDQLKEARKKLESVNDTVKEKDDTIDMLNISCSCESCSTSFSCEQCDFTTVSEKGLKIHVGRMHEVKCDKCNEKVGGEHKLKTHMCRIIVANPTIDSLYMKNWYLPNECIRVFCNEQKKQLAILHSKKCEE